MLSSSALAEYLFVNINSLIWKNGTEAYVGAHGIVHCGRVLYNNEHG
jgi:hypothetical protein